VRAAPAIAEAQAFTPPGPEAPLPNRGRRTFPKRVKLVPIPEGKDVPAEDRQAPADAREIVKDRPPAGNTRMF
jgi:hypothetical protein